MLSYADLTSQYHHNKSEACLPCHGNEHWPLLKSLRLIPCFQNHMAKAQVSEMSYGQKLPLKVSLATDGF